MHPRAYSHPTSTATPKNHCGDIRNIYSRMRKSILTSMILVPAVPFVLILGIGYFYFASALTSSGIATVSRVVGDHQQMIESFLLERRADLEFVQASVTLTQLADPAVLGRVFDQLRKKSSAFADLGVFDADGVHIAYKGPYRLSGKVYIDTHWFREVMKNGYYISDVFLGYRNIPHFIIAVAGEEQHRKWVLRATIDTLVFNDLVGKVRIGNTGQAYILNRNGIFQTERRSGGTLMAKDPDCAHYPDLANGIQTFIQKGSRGKFLSIRHVSAQGRRLDPGRPPGKGGRLQSAQNRCGIDRSGCHCPAAGGIIAVAFLITDRIVRRITTVDAEKDRLQDQLIRAGRLAELGEMAAGFAHEINNPLQIMKSEQALIETILEDMQQTGELKASEDLRQLDDSMAQIALQIGRCAKITRAILKFGRHTEPEYQHIDLKQFIPEITALVAKKAEVHGAAMVQDISAQTPPVYGDPAQLQQVLLNLFNNALDAMIEKHGAAGGICHVTAGPHDNRNGRNTG